VGELLFWGSSAKKYKRFGGSRIQFGESETFWQIVYEQSGKKRMNKCQNEERKLRRLFFGCFVLFIPGK